MKKSMALILLGVLVVLAVSFQLFAKDVDLKGVTPGKWSMDLEAAKQLAGEKKLPILLNFSGSDWCGWCKLMEENVFSKDAWKDYAKENLLMVVIDFPRDTTIVPEAYVDRNAALQQKYEVEGFPTFVVLDDDGVTELGRLGAEKEKTPASFIDELSGIFRYRTADIEGYTKSLKPEDKAKYIGLATQISDCAKAVAEQEQQIAAAQQRIEELDKKLAELKHDAQAFRAAQLGEAALKQFTQLRADVDKATQELKDWMEIGPQRSEENMQKYQAMRANIEQLSAELAKY